LALLGVAIPDPHPTHDWPQRALHNNAKPIEATTRRPTRESAIPRGHRAWRRVRSAP
jgi:hypothetical protein